MKNLFTKTYYNFLFKQNGYKTIYIYKGATELVCLLNIPNKFDYLTLLRTEIKIFMICKTKSATL